MPGYDRHTLEQLLDGGLPATETHAIMSSFKDADRFEQMLAIYADRLGWSDRILLPFGERLFIVQLPTGERVVRCECGHELGDYRVNWKLSANVFVRNTKELIDEVYGPLLGPDPSWMEIREFFCPGCFAQLEVEAVPPGYPIVHEFEPDLEAFYSEWLGRPLDGAPPAP
jgi:acetone carboxylase gamma subunit